MRKEEFTFDSRDGKTKVYACAFYPEQEPICILQIVHGMKDRIARYEEFAQYLTDRGVLVVGNDHLGHGKTVKEGDIYGYFCENDPATVLVRDVHRLKKTMEEKYPTIPYIIYGHSMGSFIVRNYMARYGTGVEGIILAGTGTPTKAELLFGKCLTGVIGKVKGTKYVSKLVDNISTKSYMSGIENAKTEHDWLSKNEETIAAFVADPLCSGYTFTVNGYDTLFELALRMQKKENLFKIPKKLPILIVSGTEDPVGNKGLAPKKLYDDYLNLDLTKTALKLYSGVRHEVLREKNRDTVYTDIYNWIERIAMEDAKK
ncbi:MAG: alpha/beta fold hydrolase [Lachnospiraceae bacterium]|nr:alpha/beta fold hydrolase [Lachnospiraceae bacterium]